MISLTGQNQSTQTNKFMVTSEKVTDQQLEAEFVRRSDSVEELERAEAELAATLSFLRAKGVKLQGNLLDMSDWLTIKRYAEKYDLSTQVVTNWIARGVIPADCVKDVPELNDLRLVKDQPYR
jgi:hypothetical protein